MGFNFGSICVRVADGVTQDRVVELIDAYWMARGATRRTKNILKVEPLTLDDGGDELSFGVSPDTGGWITVADSERYHACRPLAQHLSAALATETVWFEITEVADAASYTRYQDGAELANIDEDDDASSYSSTMEFLDGADLPHFGLYFDDMSKRAWADGGFRTFGYRGVSDDDYHGGDPTEDDATTETPEDDTRIADLAWQVFTELPTDPSTDLDRAFTAAGKDWTGDLDDLGDLLLGARRWDRALELAEAITRNDARTDTHRLRADALLGLARFDDATPYVLHLLLARADLLQSYDRLAYLYAQTGRRKLASELAAARRALEDVLYTDNRELWPLEPGAEQTPAAARATLANTLRDELADAPLAPHTRHELTEFLELAAKLEGPAELAARVAAELARRDDLRARIATADPPSARRLLAELPLADGPVDSDDPDLRLDLLDRAFRAGDDAALGDLLRLGGSPDLLPFAQRRARVDASLYHPAAIVALAAGQRELALDLARGALRAYCPTFLDMERDPALAALHDEPRFRALFADLATRPILARDDDGDGPIHVREHFIVAFFVPGPLTARLAAKLERILDAYLAYIPGGSLAHGVIGIHASRGEDTRPFDDKLLRRIRKQLGAARLAKTSDAYVELFGPDDGNAPYYVEIAGDADEDMNVVEMRFPPELVERRGLAAFRAWVETVATYLPYACGFATRALSPHHDDGSNATQYERLAAIARWHGGLDAVETVELRLGLGDRIAGAKWLTFLDHKKLRRLGGVDLLARVLEPHGVRVAGLANGAVVEAGTPDRGRGDAFANREQLRRVHAALAPVISLAWNFNGALDEYPGGAEAYLRRFLGDLALPPPPNPILVARAGI